MSCKKEFKIKMQLVTYLAAYCLVPYKYRPKVLPKLA